MSSENLCQICKSIPQKYSCPRCNIEYCSVGCYKSPNHQKCSEEFFKDCVLEEMSYQSKSKNPPKQSADVKKMYEMLRRVENDPPIAGDFDLSDLELDSDDDEEDDDEEDGTGNDEDDNDLASRLEGIDLDDADAIWSMLNENERSEFNKIVQSEDVSSILPKLSAWWEKSIKRKLVTEMNGDETEQPEESVDHPKIIESIKDFGLISTKPPAPCVINNLINVLASYTLMVRYFYGEPDTNKSEAVNYLLAICANLRTNANFDDSSVAVESIRQDAHNDGYLVDEHDVRQIQKDIDCLMQGPVQDKQTNTYLLAALSELHRLLTALKTEQKSTHGNGNDNGAAEGMEINMDQATDTNTSQEAFSDSSQNTNQSEQFSKRFTKSNRIQEYKNLEKVKLSPLIKKIEYYLAYVNKFL